MAEQIPRPVHFLSKGERSKIHDSISVRLRKEAPYWQKSSKIQYYVPETTGPTLRLPPLFRVGSGARGLAASHSPGPAHALLAQPDPVLHAQPVLRLHAQGLHTTVTLIAGAMAFLAVVSLI